MKKAILILMLMFVVVTGCQPTAEELISENIAKLNNDNPYTRQQAIASLGATLDPTVIAPIALMLSDSENAVVEQAYKELNRLKTVDQPVISEMLKLFKETERQWQALAIAYFKEIEDVRLDEVVVQNIEIVTEDLVLYRDLLLITQNNNDLLEKLWTMTENEKAKELILYLDSLGYTPSVERYETLFERYNEDSSVLENHDISLILQLLVRDSFDVKYEENERISVELKNKELIDINNFSTSQKRCEEADMFLAMLPKKINQITKAVLIRNEHLRYEKFIKDIKNTGYDETMFLIEDLETLEDDYLEIVSQYLANDEKLNEEVETSLEVRELMAAAFIEHSPEEDLLEQNKILVVYSNGDFIPKLHWKLDKKYRPKEKDEIRYIFSVPKTSGLLTCTDRYYNHEILHEEVGDETDLYKLMIKAIEIIEKKE